MPLALVLVLLSGIGPVIAWRRATPSNARRNFALPVGIARGDRVVLAVVTGVARTAAGAGDVRASRRSSSPRVGQEFVRGVRARRAMAGESRAASRSLALVRRNRRRYGGYTVHVGMALLFIGVAASSAFQHARDVQLRPGQTATGQRLPAALRRPRGGSSRATAAPGEHRARRAA